MDINELIYRTEIGSQTLKINLWLKEEKCRRGINQEYGINIYTLSHIKQKISKDLL